jgi:hypothetical protein
MPLPKPKKNEDKDAFLARCMASATIQKEFNTNEQRLAVCNTIWESSDRKDESSGHFVQIEKTDEINKVVKGIVYTAGYVDTDGETMSVDEVQKACWNFLALRKEKNIDIQHDWQESGCYVVESYLTEKDDPNFPENSWVMAVKCTDPIFEKVVKGELNGFSFGGYSTKYSKRVLMEVAKQIVGETEYNLNKDVIPAHKHNFSIWFNVNGQIEKGMTDVVDGHSHSITMGTATDFTIGHSHRIDINAEE